MMKPIRDWDIFRVEPVKDLLMVKLFTIIAITWLTLQMCLLFALSFIAEKNNYENAPWVISPLLNLAGILTIAMPVSILVQDAIGLYFNRVRSREKSAEYLDFLQQHFPRME